MNRVGLWLGSGGTAHPARREGAATPGRLRSAASDETEPPRSRPSAVTLIPSVMPVWFQTALLLTASNVFMTFAWYAHLKDLSGKPWVVAALLSWGLALFEYLLQVPANRIGYTALSLGQLKVMQEVIALGVFVPFAVFYMRESLRLDFLWAALCLIGAAYFMFRS